jgi:hypothetical protein
MSFLICGQSENLADNLLGYLGCPLDNLAFNPYFERCTDAS